MPAGAVEGGDHLLDRELAEVAAEVPPGAARRLRALGGVPRRHRDAVDTLRPERVDGERGDERRVDPAREPEHDVAEAVLADVVPEASTSAFRICSSSGANAQMALDAGTLCLLHGAASSTRPTGALVARRSSARRRTSRSRRPIASLGSRSTTSSASSKPGARASDLALVVEHDRVPVEDELVLSADEVAEGEVGGVVAGPRDEHLLAVLRLADVVRRGREVDEQRRAGEREIGRRGPGCQMSSQIVGPTRISPSRSRISSRPEAK